MALLAMSLAATWLLGSMPALASPVSKVRQQEWWLTKLGVTRAWRTSEGAGVLVAVLSDGVDASQPDLSGSVTTGPDFTNSGQAAGSRYFGVQGTAVASLIAGHGHGTGDSAGVIGVAPAAKILSVRVTLSSGDPLLADAAIAAGLPAAIAAGIRYAVSHGATVIDLPLDPAQANATGSAAATSAAGLAAERAAVRYAEQHGVVLVAPAGDNGAGTDAVNYPAADRGVVSVGAFDKNFIKAAYTSHQPYVTLTAPGTGVIAAVPSGYTTMNSTVASSAIVAGIAALIRSHFPNLTPTQVTKALTDSTVFRPVGGRLDGSGYGTANANRAVTRAAKIAGPTPTRQASPTARPHVRPTAPANSSADPTIAPRLLRDGVIAAAVLIILLLPITAYGTFWWRRRRREAQAAVNAARWQRPAPDPDGYAETEDAEPMASMFAARPFSARPDEPAGRADDDALAGPRVLPGSGWPAGTGLGNGGVSGDWGYEDHAAAGLAGTGAGGHAGAGGRNGFGGRSSLGGNGFGGNSFGDNSIRGGAAGGDSAAAAPADSGPLAPAADRGLSRLDSKPPQISGAPPWEPAPRPDSELPWAVSQAPSAVSRRASGLAVNRDSAADPPWDEMLAAADSTVAGPSWADSSWIDSTWAVPAAPADGGSATTGERGSSADAPDALDGDGDGDGGGYDDGTVYTWSPGASTEAFPAVPRDYERDYE